MYDITAEVSICILSADLGAWRIPNSCQGKADSVITRSWYFGILPLAMTALQGQTSQPLKLVELHRR